MRGRLCIAPVVSALPHPASKLLDELRRVGAPILCTTREWTQAQKDAAVIRGSHKSATEYSDFVEEEMVDMGIDGLKSASLGPGDGTL